MRNKIVLLILLAASAGGCSNYTASQMRLAEQARKGVAIWQQRETDRDAQAQREFAARQKALDDAFDADVRQRNDLSSDWVIEARKAYAIGLDLAAQSRAASLTANDAARRNAAATDQALQQLIWLMSMQLDLQTLIENGGGK